MSFDQPPAALDERGRLLLADVSSTAARFGEPFVSLFRREEAEQLLTDHGFGGVTHFGADDAQRRYFGQANMGMPDVQRLVTATVT